MHGCLCSGARLRRIARILAGLWLLALVALATPGGAAAAGKRCHGAKRPARCARAPRNARRPKGINQQGPRSLTPRDVENGGGIGGGGDASRTAAVLWAKSQLGHEEWAWRCERFVEEAYGTRYRFASAAAAERHLALDSGPVQRAPAGALVYFRADAANRGAGHVGLSLGDGRMISALGTVRVTDVVKSAYWRARYRGWTEAPGAWPGRIPPPPGPSIELPESTIRLTAPAFASTVGGPVDLTATATGVYGVAFAAYYAGDPADPGTVAWHYLGTGTETPFGYGLTWDTSAVPDQGDPRLGTVNVAAIALDRMGELTGTRDYRRIAIDNHTGALVPVPTPTPAPGPTTYPETAGGNANTWTDYTSAGGVRGPGIPGGQTVAIACKVTGFRVADGNTWWYRIASAPWNGGYYVSADAFYNDGRTSGSLVGTPFVDEHVADC